LSHESTYIHLASSWALVASKILSRVLLGHLVLVA
jgi:hypothetical protein